MRRKKSAKIKALFAFVLIIVIVVFSFVYFRGNLIDYTQKYTSALITTKVVDALNLSTTQAIEGDFYQDKSNFYEIRYDEQGNVTLISANVVIINKLLNDVSEYSQINVNTLCENDDIQVPYSSIFGSVLLANYGKKYTFNLELIGNIQCDYFTTFESAGINQTLLSMHIDLKVDISVLLPLHVENIRVENTMIVYQNLIVGEVPDFYFESNGSLDLLG